jgi:hypothetical protein
MKGSVAASGGLRKESLAASVGLGKEFDGVRSKPKATAPVYALPNNRGSVGLGKGMRGGATGSRGQRRQANDDVKESLARYHVGRCVCIAQLTLGFDTDYKGWGLGFPTQQPTKPKGLFVPTSQLAFSVEKLKSQKQEQTTNF